MFLLSGTEITFTDKDGNEAEGKVQHQMRESEVQTVIKEKINSVVNMDELELSEKEMEIINKEVNMMIDEYLERVIKEKSTTHQGHRVIKEDKTTEYVPYIRFGSIK